METADVSDDVERVLSMTVHPQESLVAIGTDASIVKVWNVKTKMYEDALPQIGHVLAVHFSSCGSYLAAASSSREQETYLVSLWSVTNADAEFSFSLLTDDRDVDDTHQATGNGKLHQDDITCLQFRPTSVLGMHCEVLASGSADQTVRFWHFADFEEGMTRRIYRDMHSETVTSLSFSDQGRLMASCALDRTVVLWKFSPRTVADVMQTVRISTYDEVPYAISFFPAHPLVPNGFREPLREYYFSVGTNKALHVYYVVNTRVPVHEKVLEWDLHTKHGADEVRIDVFSDEEDTNKARREKKVHGHVGDFLDEERSFRSLRETDERPAESLEEDDFDQSMAQESFIQVRLAQHTRVRDGIRSLQSVFYVIQPEDFWAKVWGCMYVVAGGFKRDVHLITLSAVRFPKRLLNEFDVNQCVIDRHEGMVTCVAAPTTQLTQDLLRNKHLQEDQAMVLSGSIDESIHIVKWTAEPLDGHDSVSDVPRRYRPHPPGEKDPPVILQRPLTEHKANKLYALKEAVRIAETETKRKLEEDAHLSGRVDRYGALYPAAIAEGDEDGDESGGKKTKKKTQQQGGDEDGQQQSGTALDSFQTSASAQAGKVPPLSTELDVMPESEVHQKRGMMSETAKAAYKDKVDRMRRQRKQGKGSSLTAFAKLATQHAVLETKKKNKGGARQCGTGEGEKCVIS